MNYNKVYEKVGKRIRFLRRERGISQEELAAKAGVNRAYMWELEKGRNMSIRTAYKISKGLGVPLSRLFDLS